MDSDVEDLAPGVEDWHVFDNLVEVAHLLVVILLGYFTRFTLKCCKL